jgi:AraC-like DNA-binding protein
LHDDTQAKQRDKCECPKGERRKVHRSRASGERKRRDKFLDTIRERGRPLVYAPCSDVPNRSILGNCVIAASAPIALRSVLRHMSQSTLCEVSSISLRRPELVLRRTRYANLVVDERMLTAAFPWISGRTHLLGLLLLGGRIDWPDLHVEAGDAVLLLPEQMALGRFEDATFVELEWSSPRAKELDAPRKTGSVPKLAYEVEGLLLDGQADQRGVFARGFEAFRAAGVDHGLSADALQGGPSAMEVRLARAIDAQFASIGTCADTMHLAELAEVSPRQVHRLMTAYIGKMNLNARSWRDLRNRWRVQIAAVLLGHETATIAKTAAEVGYASAPALARAFAASGLPSPREIRRHLMASAWKTDPNRTFVRGEAASSVQRR